VHVLIVIFSSHLIVIVCLCYAIRTHRKQGEKWISNSGAFSLRRDDEAWNLEVA